MTKGRLEAFSDGVLAIIITIMVLEMKAPQGHSLEALKEVLPHFISYVSSFIFLAIYWVNHHHLLQTATKVNAGILWANINLLFWLSLLPFATSWISEDYVATLPTILYALIIFISGTAYKLLAYLIVHNEGRNSHLHKAFNQDKKYISDVKGIVTALLNFTSLVVAFFYPLIAQLILSLVALSWVIPDRRFEKAYEELDEYMH